MRTNSLKNTVFAVAGVMVASVSAAPSLALTPIFTTSSSDDGVTIESFPMVVPGTGTYTLPSGLNGGPGPVITSGTGTGTDTGSATDSGSVSIPTSSSTNSTGTTTSGTGTTTASAPASTSSIGAGLPAYASSKVLVSGLFVLSAAGVHLL